MDEFKFKVGDMVVIKGTTIRFKWFILERITVEDTGGIARSYRLRAFQETEDGLQATTLVLFDFEVDRPPEKR